MDTLVCWKCGASLDALSLPLRRLEECDSCSADLHVCRLCTFYDVKVAKHCREPIADEVKDKERANFCDYFQPVAGAFIPPDDAVVRQARNGLDALFGVDEQASQGSEGKPADDAQKKLEQLFGLDDEGNEET